MFRPETTKEKNAVRIIKQFLKNELFNPYYGFKWDVKIDSCEEYGDGELYIESTIYQFGKELKSLSFKLVDVPEDEIDEDEDNDSKIFIECHEDNYEEIEPWNDSIKFFWIAFMEWPEIQNIKGKI